MQPAEDVTLDAAAVAALVAERDSYKAAHAERCRRVDELVAERDALQRALDRKQAANKKLLDALS